MLALFVRFLNCLQGLVIWSIQIFALQKQGRGWDNACLYYINREGVGKERVGREGKGWEGRGGEVSRHVWTCFELLYHGYMEEIHGHQFQGHHIYKKKTLAT